MRLNTSTKGQADGRAGGISHVLISPEHRKLHWRCIFQHGADLFNSKSLNLNVSTQLD